MVEVSLPIRITSELAYLCGVFAGDGSINYRVKKHEYSLTVGGNPHDEKEYYREILGPIMKEVFDVIPTMKLCGGGTTFGFIIYSKKLIEYLTETIGLPLGPKYEKLCIPPIFKQNDDFIISFIRGLFDTDGCISFRKNRQRIPMYPVISVSSKSEKFMVEIKECLIDLGLDVPSIYVQKMLDSRFKKGYAIVTRLEISGKNKCRRWLSLIGFGSPKHLKKIDKYWKEK